MEAGKLWLSLKLHTPLYGRKAGALALSPQPRSAVLMTAKQIKKPGDRRVISFPQAKNKTLTVVEFSTAPAEHNITLMFNDQTALTFEICPEPRFSLAADYSNWKTGNERFIKRWRHIPANF
jgi:hypothetical protein